MHESCKKNQVIIDYVIQQFWKVLGAFPSGLDTRYLGVSIVRLRYINYLRFIYKISSVFTLDFTKNI